MKKRFKRGISDDLIYAKTYIARKTRKVVGVIMILFMLVGSVLQSHQIVNASTYDLPTETQMDSNTSNNDAMTTQSKPYRTTTDDSFNASTIALQSEDVSKRTENSKTFLKVDGTKEVEIYNDAVHYLDNGFYKDIDNRLQLNLGTNTFDNLANKFKIKLPKVIDDSKKIKLSVDKYEMDWTINNINDSNIIYNNDNYQSNNLKDLTNINQTVKYCNVQKDVDLEYKLSGDRIKENIILNSYLENYSLSYTYDLKGLSLEQNSKGENIFVNEEGKTVFSFSQIYMIDADGDISYDVMFDVQSNKKDEYQISIIPDNNYLKTAIYPVTIDPTIVSTSQYINIENAYIDEGNPDSNIHNSDFLKVESDYAGMDTRYSLIKFSLPQIDNNSIVTYANLNLAIDFTSSLSTIAEQVNMYALTTHQDIYDLCWNNWVPTYYDNNLVDYNLININTSKVSYDLLNLVKNWVDNPASNHGLIFMSQGIAGIGQVIFDSTNASGAPIVSIGYTAGNGIKSYWTYNSQNAGDAGTGYVSNFSGELNFLRNDINFTTDKQELGVSFSYSNYNEDKNLFYGYGWDVNYDIQLVDLNNMSDASNAYYYIVDNTGAKVYYYDTGESDSRLNNSGTITYKHYVAEDGSGNLIVKKYDNGNLVDTYLLSKNSSEYRFTNYNVNGEIKSLLTSIKQGNVELHTYINRNSNGSIDNIKDDSNNYIVFNYNSTTGLLDNILLRTSQIISDRSSTSYLEKVTYSYSSNQLTHVTHYFDYNKDDSPTSNETKEIYYTYTSTNQLKQAYVSYEQRVDYVYQSTTVDKVSQIKQYYNNNVPLNTSSNLTNSVTYEYSINQTKITKYNDDFMIYSFDTYGHTVNVFDNKGDTACFYYYDIFNDPSTYLDGGGYNYYWNNLQIASSQPENNTNYYFLNNSFENYDPLENWTKVGLGTVYASTDHEDGANSLALYNPSGLNGFYMQQEITLLEGSYTINVYAKSTSGSSNGYIEVGTQTSLSLPNDGQWHQLVLPINVTDAQSTITLELVNSGSGTVYFDDVNILSGNQASNSELLRNQSFENGTSDWSSNITGNLTYYSSSGNGDIPYSAILGRSCVGLSSAINSPSEIYQFINKSDIPGLDTSDGQLTIGGWANKYSALGISNVNYNYNNEEPIDKLFEIKVEFYKSGNRVDGVHNQYFSFNQYTQGWQYIYRNINIPSDIDFDQIRVAYVFQGVGEVLFDDLSVGFKANLIKTTYDSHGNPVSFTNGNGNKYNIDYSNGIAEYIEDADGNVVYTFGNDGQTINSVTFNNVTTDISKNSYGQTYNVKVSNGDYYFQTSTSYTFNDQYVYSQTNEFGKTTTYNTDTVTGLLNYISNSKGVKTQFEYYDNGQLKKVYYSDSFDDTKPYVEYLYNSQNQLTKISSGDLAYYLIYDSNTGLLKSVTVNGQHLVDYDYIVDSGVYNTDKIYKKTYGNNSVIKFGYNTNNQIDNIQTSLDGVNFTDTFKYTYDSFGRVSTYYDLMNNASETYQYDSQGNLVKAISSNGNETDYTYDPYGNIIGLYFNISNGISSNTEYSYYPATNDNIYNKTTFDGGSKTLTYNYETGSLKRLYNLKLMEGSNTLTSKSYSFITGTSNSTQTNRIRVITYYVNNYSKNFTYSYEYDELGNITKETYMEGSSRIIKTYEYDDYNQLIEESSNDASAGSCSVASDTCYSKYYSYDSHGNITDAETLLYGQDVNSTPTAPSSYLVNYGSIPVTPYFNGHIYSTIYYLSVGQSPSLSFTYYDSDFGSKIYSTMYTSQTDSNLDVYHPGYYYRDYEAFNSTGTYQLDFRIIFKVGNPVLVPQEQITYNYNSNWTDLLDSYSIIENGTTTKTSNFTYDNQGNPTNITSFIYNGTLYDHISLSWLGRQLTKIRVYNSSGTPIITISYTYNDQGYRTSKTINGNKTSYYLQGDKVLYQTNGYYAILYTYDYDGSLIGYKYYSNVIYFPNQYQEFFYITDITGNITALQDESGNLIAKYTYDAYGNQKLTVLNTSYNTAINANPYTYKGYRYDKEINMYYLNSRFYSPEIGRFISSDGIIGQVGDPLSLNMYAYCSNNPVMYLDPSGEFALFVITAAIGAIIGGVTGAYRAYTNGNSILGGLINGALVGGAIGFALGTGIVFLGPVIAGAGAGTLTSTAALSATYAFVGSTIVSFGAGTLGYIIEESINRRNPEMGSAFGNGLIVSIESTTSFGFGGIIGSVGTIGDTNFISLEWFAKQVFIQEFTYPSRYLFDKLRYMIFD